MHFKPVFPRTLDSKLVFCIEIRCGLSRQFQVSLFGCLHPNAVQLFPDFCPFCLNDALLLDHRIPKLVLTVEGPQDLNLAQTHPVGVLHLGHEESRDVLANHSFTDGSSVLLGRMNKETVSNSAQLPS